MAESDRSWWSGTPSGELIALDPAAFLGSRGVNVPADTPEAVVFEALRIVTLLWSDGRIIPIDDFRIDPADEGLLFGRGVWESTRTRQGVPWLWPWHLDRLRKTAAVLGIAIEAGRLPEAAEVTNYVRSLTGQDVVIRLNVTAGRPGAAGRIWMSASLPPVPPEAIRLKIVANPIQPGQPYLLWKTFQYATRLRVGQQASQAGYDSALLMDADGLLLEASHANLYVRLADGWATPAANGGLLPGTVRQFLLQQAPLKIREQPIPAGLLGEATEVFVTNSNLGIVPVTRIDERTFPIGEETKALRDWLCPPEMAGPRLQIAERVAPVR